MRGWVIRKQKIKQYLSDPIDKRNFNKIISIEEDISLPEISEDEALIKIKSTGLNLNSIWTLEAYQLDSC